MTSKVNFTEKLHKLVQEDKQQMTRWVRVDGRLSHILYIQDGELSPLGDQTEKIKKLASLIITAHGRDFEYIDSKGAHFADKIQSHDISIQQTPLIDKEKPTAQDAWNLLEKIAQSNEWVEKKETIVLLPDLKENQPLEDHGENEEILISSPLSSRSDISSSSGYLSAFSNSPATPSSSEFVSPFSRPATPTSPKVVPFPGMDERFLSLIERTKNAIPWDKSQDSSKTCISILAKLEDNKSVFTELEKSKLKERIASLMSYRDFQPNFIPVYILKDFLKHQIDSSQ
ncbi:MAG: hypothetical protein K1060chlam2_01506 [Chlamydiae bacterium]|nr:hypothetical protein [Chlamydiota bacterium]